ncbi:MAG: hypothetical protein MZV64_46265 [Ignavibacteriales bacterium]|nr:hypothetical protein [Ignavibacteriales bacterium]
MDDEFDSRYIQLAEALKLNDVILEIAITPNRPDALSHIGVARDLAAIFNRDLRIPEIRFNRITTRYQTT